MKKHRKTIIITSIVTLMPIIAGLLLWDRMPDRIVTHWGSDNVPDGAASHLLYLEYLRCFLRSSS